MPELHFVSEVDAPKAIAQMEMPKLKPKVKKQRVVKKKKPKPKKKKKWDVVATGHYINSGGAMAVKWGKYGENAMQEKGDDDSSSDSSSEESSDESEDEETEDLVLDAALPTLDLESAGEPQKMNVEGEKGTCCKFQEEDLWLAGLFLLASAVLAGGITVLVLYFYAPEASGS